MLEPISLKEAKEANREINKKYWYLFGTSRWEEE